MTHFVGVVTRAQARGISVPPHRFRAARRAAALLVILVFTDNEVQNRVIATQHAVLGPSELEQIANYPQCELSPACASSEIRERLLREMRETSARLHQLMVGGGRMCRNRRSRTVRAADMLVAGQINLMGSQGAVRCRSPARTVRGVPAQARSAGAARKLLRAPRACACSSARNRVSRPWTAAASSRRRTASTDASSACSA